MRFSTSSDFDLSLSLDFEGGLSIISSTGSLNSTDFFPLSLDFFFFSSRFFFHFRIDFFNSKSESLSESESTPESSELSSSLSLSENMRSESKRFL